MAVTGHGFGGLRSFDCSGPGGAARLHRARHLVGFRTTSRYNQPLSLAMRTASSRLRAPVLHMIRDRWLRTVPTDRNN